MTSQIIHVIIINHYIAINTHKHESKNQAWCITAKMYHAYNEE